MSGRRSARWPLNRYVLAAPHFDLPFQLNVDASDVGVSLVLMQADDFGIECLFFSKKFPACQRNYSVIENEALALLSLKHFDVYVGGSCTPLVVYTDHDPLTFLNSLQCPNQRLVRWSLFLLVRHTLR